MTVLQRAATIAAMTFTLTGLLGHSTPGRASDLDRSAIAAPEPAPVPVPAPVMPSQTATLPNNDPAASIVPAVATVDPAGAAPVDDFDSLAEAVAAQDAEDDSEALRCLAGAVYFEAKGEPLAGQLAVANVIINRSRSGRFPADVCAVVKQRGQFSFVRGGQIPAIGAGRAYRTALAVAQVALEAAWKSPAPRALYFNTPDRMPGSGLTRVAMIGNHIFYR